MCSGGLTHQQLLTPAAPVVEHDGPGGEGRCEGLAGLRPSRPRGLPVTSAAGPVHQAEQVGGLAAAGEARDQQDSGAGVGVWVPVAVSILGPVKDELPSVGGA